MTNNLKDEIERIINGIGSPYGEGASYNRLASYDRERDGKLSHLEDYEIEELTKDITSLIEQEKERAVEELHNFVRSNTLGGRFMDDGGGYFNADAVLREDIEQYLAERKE